MDNLTKKALKDMDFVHYISDILSNGKFLLLKDYPHHNNVTRFDHCIHVAYSCYRKAVKLGYAHIRELVRGAVLHDFFLYDYTTERTIKKHYLHGVFHPSESLKQAESEFNISDIERNVIKSHMFPLSFTMPKYLASWLVISYDKYWATYECVGNVVDNRSIAKQVMYSLGGRLIYRV